MILSELNENPVDVSAPEKLKLNDEDENKLEEASEVAEELEEDSELTLEAKLKLRLRLAGAEVSVKAAELKESTEVFAKSKKLENGFSSFFLSSLLSSSSFFCFSSSCLLSSSPFSLLLCFTG